jgi:hypothetical protein
LLSWVFSASLKIIKGVYSIMFSLEDIIIKDMHSSNTCTDR